MENEKNTKILKQIDHTIKTLSQPPRLAGSQFCKQLIQDTIRNDRILAVTLLLSNLCNLNCLYCYRNGGKPSLDSLNLDEWRQVLIESKNLGAKYVRIPGSGEPFLDENFYKSGSFPILEICQEIGLSMVLFTNGTFITLELAKRLYEYDICVVTKLNSFHSSTQDKLSNTKDSAALIYRGLENLINAGFSNSNPSRLAIDTIIAKDNYDEIPNIFIYCRENNIIPYITAILHGGRTTENPQLDIPSAKLKSLFFNLLSIDQEEYGFTWFPSPPIVAGQCDRLLYDIVVDCKGDVLICPGINIPIGNIKKKKIKQIIKESELLYKIRHISKHLEGNCGRCKSKDCLYGCRLEAYTNGDLFGSDPLCWQN